MATGLCNSVPEGARRNGFDCGMAVAEGETANGPGKQAIQDTLSPDEQFGFKLAVQFSLDRNANADLAAKGAVIANTDRSVLDARESNPVLGSTWPVNDPSFYRLGFNIATGLFGDRALGAVGSRKLKHRTSIGDGAGPLFSRGTPSSNNKPPVLTRFACRRSATSVHGLPMSVFCPVCRMA